MRIEIFRTGKHTDGAGVERTYTEDDLDRMVVSYNPAKHEAPVVIGHPKDNSPAWGWVKCLAREGASLYAELRDLVPEFVECVKRGMYKKRSIAIYPDMTLRHVGFLGGMPPAVKGLADIAFSQDDNQTVIEFMDHEETGTFQMLGRMFSGVRDFFIEKFGMDVADKVIPAWDIDQLKSTQATEDTNPVTPTFTEGGSMPTVQELQAQLAQRDSDNATLTKKNTELAAQVAQFSESSASQATEIANLKAAIATIETTSRKAEHISFCENLVKTGKLAPALKDTMVAQLEIAFQASTGTFAEGQVKPVDALRKALADAPTVLQFGEVATSGAASGATDGKASAKLQSLAVAKLEANKDRSYSWAFSEVQKENPDLALAYESEVRG